MKAVLCILIISVFPLQAKSQSLTAASLLQDSRSRVSALERKADSTNGTLTVFVSFKAEILGRKAAGSAKYMITVRDGRDRKSELIGTHSFPDSTVASMMERQMQRRHDEPIMKFYLDNAFPWGRFLARADKKKEFIAVVDSDSAVVAGKRCFLISFRLDAVGDSVSAEGQGKIWIDSETLLPVRTYRDFNMKTKHGNAEVRAYSDFASLSNGIPVMVRTETQTIPKFLFVSVGSIRTVVKQSDFNLE